MAERGEGVREALFLSRARSTCSRWEKRWQCSSGACGYAGHAQAPGGRAGRDGRALLMHVLGADDGNGGQPIAHAPDQLIAHLSAPMCAWNTTEPGLRRSREISVATAAESASGDEPADVGQTCGPPRDAQNVLAEGTMRRPQRPAEIGPRSLHPPLRLPPGRAGKRGRCRQPAQRRECPAADAGRQRLSRLRRDHQADLPAAAPSPTPSPSPSPSPSPTPAPAYSGPPTLPPPPTPSRPRSRPSGRRPRPVPTPYIPPGIDVSRYQGSLAYPKVASAGIRFVYVKATQGTTIVDPYYAEHSSRAMAQGSPSARTTSSTTPRTARRRPTSSSTR